MAALLPHLAVRGETTDLERQYWSCSHARELGDADVLCPTPQQVIDVSHANLLTLAWSRKIIIEQLRGCVLTPKYDDLNQTVLIADKTPAGPVWNPMIELGKVSLLSWTSKMSAPSFSLAAGSSAIGGSCPAADAGQSVVDQKTRRAVAKTLVPILGIKQVNLPNAVCQYCYATKGQYPTASNQFFGLARYIWARQAVNHDLRGKRTDPGAENCAFVHVMIDAIERADFYLEGYTQKYTTAKVDGKKQHVVLEEPIEKIPPEAAQWHGQRFFRLHDSGDFFDLAYLRAWKHVANHFHPHRYTTGLPIVFWAPTRIWAMGKKWIDFVNEINSRPGDKNLILRPSGYHVNQHGVPDSALGRRKTRCGWSASTVVYDHDSRDDALQRTYDWNCQAYAVDKSPNCRRSKNPDGLTGCRTCWMEPDTRVNYTLH